MIVLLNELFSSCARCVCWNAVVSTLDSKSCVRSWRRVLVRSDLSFR
ncbi:hypothetical protein M6B38_310285 [Iris pallida]|uniref:Uncharacterized protein n=1 Tax=Iris pallida TaxID=29817 RepID=A0AAX6HI81_IRIPA|nr:hypothetical protein M6B38_310285 [Iris pallida]